MSAKMRLHRGFTLIELLVVIAVIGILASILMPVLAMGKRKAKTAVSLSNMHQMFLAYSMFAEDHNNHFPWNFQWHTPRSVRGGALHKYGPVLNHEVYRMDALVDALNTPKILHSPCDPIREVENNKVELDFSNVRYNSSSYGFSQGASYLKPNSILAFTRNINTGGPMVNRLHLHQPGSRHTGHTYVWSLCNSLAPKWSNGELNFEKNHGQLMTSGGNCQTISETTFADVYNGHVKSKSGGFGSPMFDGFGAWSGHPTLHMFNP